MGPEPRTAGREGAKGTLRRLDTSCPRFSSPRGHVHPQAHVPLRAGGGEREGVMMGQAMQIMFKAVLWPLWGA